MLTINIKLKDNELMFPNVCDKIAALVEVLPANLQSITGEITNDKVDLNLTTLSCQDEIKIAGKWNEETEEMIVFVWNENIPVSHFNFHPIDSMGGFDLKQFKEEVKKINQ